MQKAPLDEKTSVAKKALIFIYSILFLDMMGSSLLLPIVPYIVRQYSSNTVTVGLLSVLYSAAAFFSAPVLGKLSDRFGRRPVLLACVFGSAVGYLMFGLGGALWVLFIARLVDGVTGGNIAAAMAYLADSSRPQERAKYFAFAGVAFGLGFVLGPLIAAAFSTISVAAPAFAAGGLSFASFLFGLFFLPESLPPEKRDQGRLSLAQANPFTVIWQAARLPNLSWLFAARIALYLANAGIFTYFAVYTLNRFGVSAAQNSILFVLVGVFQVVGQGGIVYRLTPRYGEKKVALLGLITQALVYLFVPAVVQFWWLAPLVIISALGNALTRPTLDALVANSVSPEEQGRAQGSTAALDGLTNAIGPLLAGFAYNHLSPTSVFTGGGLLIAASAALLTRVKDKHSRS